MKSQHLNIIVPASLDEIIFSSKKFSTFGSGSVSGLDRSRVGVVFPWVLSAPGMGPRFLPGLSEPP